MGRRVELANAADGMTGHFIREAGWERDWILGDLARAAVISGADPLRLVFEGAGRQDTREARILRADLQRHLQRRRIPAEWVVEATLEVWVLSVRGRESRTRGRISIVDDLGRTCTSTRTTRAWLPRFGVISRIGRRLLAGR